MYLHFISAIKNTQRKSVPITGDDNFISNESGSIFNSLNKRDCKQKIYSCPPKPDTPPVRPSIHTD